jgi:hypothetical protein
MSTLKQIEANRLNAQKSTGPTSAEGKAAVRFNALKSGIHAQSQVIPGEDPAVLALLIAEYYDRYQPATPEVRALVDTLITAEWLQRRFRTLEAQIWRYNLEGLYTPVKGLDMAQVWDPGCEDFNRLQRRIDAADRSYHRALAALQKIESRAPQPSERCEPPDPPAPDPRPVTPDLPDPQLPPNQPPAPEIGFVPSIPPAPIDSVVSQPDTSHEIPSDKLGSNP